MKNLKVCNDNILIRAKIKRPSGIVLPDTEKDKIKGKLESVMIVDVGNKAMENCPEVKIGDKVLLDINPTTLPAYNEAIGAKESLDDKENDVYYYFIKPFNILTIID